MSVYDHGGVFKSSTARDGFIRFLKDSHAFDEWKAAVGGEKTATEILDGIDAGTEAEDALLEDGWYMHHRDADSAVAWHEVDKSWKHIYKNMIHGTSNSTTLEATITFRTREEAVDFSVAYQRMTLRGHMISGKSVHVYGVSPEEKLWIDKYVADMNKKEKHEA